MIDMFHKLEQLDKLRSDLKIQVRVTRMWPSVENNGKLTGFNMILLDQEDYHVHAFVHSEIWNDLQNHVFEGNIYDFKNFVTQDATGTFRPVNTNMSIVLTNLTIVTPVLLEKKKKRNWNIGGFVTWETEECSDSVF